MDDMTRASPQQGSQAGAEGQPAAAPIDADRLFRGREVLVIEFRGACYQLRQTRNGKLILTK